MASTTARCLLDGSRSASPPARWWSVRYCNGLRTVLHVTKPFGAIRQINNGKGSTRLVARAGPGTAQPGREGSTISPEEYYPLIRVSSSLRSDETSLAVSILSMPEITVVNRRFRSRPGCLCEGDFSTPVDFNAVGCRGLRLHRRVVKTRNVQITLHTHGRQSAPTRTVRAPMVHHDVRRSARYV